MPTESLYVNSHNRFGPNSQKVEATFVLINRRISKQTKIYNEIILRNRNNWTTEIYKMIKSQKLYADLKKLDTEQCICLIPFTYKKGNNDIQW